MNQDPFAELPESEEEGLLDRDELLRGTFEEATQGKRFVNYLLDSIFFLVIYFLYLMIASIIIGDQVLEESEGVGETILTYLLWFAFYAIPEGILGKSPAKFLTRTTVVDEQGGKITWKMALIRSACRFIPFEAFSFIRGNPPRGWHDSMSNTYVVLDKSLY